MTSNPGSCTVKLAFGVPHCAKNLSRDFYLNFTLTNFILVYRSIKLYNQSSGIVRPNGPKGVRLNKMSYDLVAI